MKNGKTQKEGVLHECPVEEEKGFEKKAFLLAFNLPTYFSAFLPNDCYLFDCYHPVVAFFPSGVCNCLFAKFLPSSRHWLPEKHSLTYPDELISYLFIFCEDCPPSLFISCFEATTLPRQPVWLSTCFSLWLLGLLQYFVLRPSDVSYYQSDS